MYVIIMIKLYLCVVGIDYAVQCAEPEMSDQEVMSDVSKPVSVEAVVVEDQQQSDTIADTLSTEVDLNVGSANSENTADTANVDDPAITNAVSDGIQQAVLPAATEQTVQLVGMSASVITSTENTCQPLQAVPTVSSTGQMSGVSLAAKSQTFVLCQVTSGGQTVLIPQSVVSGIQLSSGTSYTPASSVTRVPVLRSAIPLRTISSDKHAIAALSSTSSTSAAVAVTQTSAGVLLRPATNGVQVTNNAANRAGAGVVLNRGTAPQRLAVAIAPANSTVRPTGTGSIRLVAIRNGTPLAIGGVRASGSAVTTPQLRLLASAMPLSGARPPITASAAAMAVSSSVQVTPTVTAVRQQTAVSDVQAYLRRIQEMKSSQPEQGTKAPVTLTTTVRTPLKAKTVLPSLSSAQQIVVMQSGSQPQLASISAAQLVCTFCYMLLLFVVVFSIAYQWRYITDEREPVLQLCA